MLTPRPIKRIILNLPIDFPKIASIVALCDLRPNEKILFEHACELVVCQLRSDGILPPDIATNIFFLDTDDITLTFTPSQMGSCLVGIFYPVHKWRSAGYTDQQIITCMVEEMCHVFWCIKDETLVKFKVLDVLKIGHPDLPLESLYSFPRSQ